MAAEEKVAKTVDSPLWENPYGVDQPSFYDSGDGGRTGECALSEIHVDLATLLMAASTLKRLTT